MGAAAGVFFFKFTLCQGSNVGREGQGGPVGRFRGVFLPLGYLYFNFF